MGIYKQFQECDIVNKASWNEPENVYVFEIFLICFRVKYGILSRTRNIVANLLTFNNFTKKAR